MTCMRRVEHAFLEQDSTTFQNPTDTRGKFEGTWLKCYEKNKPKWNLVQSNLCEIIKRPGVTNFRQEFNHGFCSNQIISFSYIFFSY